MAGGRLQDLERYEPIENDLPGLVDDTETALRDLLLDFKSLAKPRTHQAEHVAPLGGNGGHRVQRRREAPSAQRPVS